jgi:ABC-type branched-subunit amino acid transport system ATPase component
VVDPLGISGFSASFIEVGRGELASIPYPILVAAAVVIAAGVALTRTVTGLRLYAVGGDARAAERAGVRVRKVVLGAYAFNGMLIGLIAVLTTARLGSGTPTLGVQFEFDVLTAVILGGVAFAGGAGRPLGVLIGVLTIGVLNAGLVFEGLQDWWQEIARGSILVLALAADQLSVARRDRRAARGGAPLPDAAAPVAPPRAAANGHRPARGAPTGPPVLEIDGVSKRFGAVRALQPTSLALHAGEVVALLGDNGAGKSTLVKIVSGAVRPDAGELRLDGERVVFKDPADARATGVETVYQDLALCPNLSVTHNLVLGHEPTRRVGPLRFRDDRRGTEDAQARLAALGIGLPDPSALVEGLSGGQRQAIAVARALDDHVKVVCLDEPTAALGVTQTEQVLELVRSVAEQGTGVLMITHDVASVMRVCDRVVVLRHGALVYAGPTAELREVELLQLMAGMDIDAPQAGRQADELVR